jgi:hypothetical protein
MWIMARRLALFAVTALLVSCSGAKQQSSAPPAPPIVTTTDELPAGSEVSVRTSEAIDSATAVDGQTYEVMITRDARGADGNVVIPRAAHAGSHQGRLHQGSSRNHPHLQAG